MKQCEYVNKQKSTTNNSQLQILIKHTDVGYI